MTRRVIRSASFSIEGLLWGGGLLGLLSLFGLLCLLCPLGLLGLLGLLVDDAGLEREGMEASSVTPGDRGACGKGHMQAARGDRRADCPCWSDS